MCPPGQRYLDCDDLADAPMPGRGLACEQTCESHLLNLTCSAHEPCVPGCACPPGGTLVTRSGGPGVGRRAQIKAI
ncbi:hypothetical protein AAFF_G00300990 [Aldrovandia affinis]|uniref:TIL domain-containing protein n=1 Tax=Aldrovandia affinis TaxID=143900 RepID=A0AAD7SQ16_9TELE|nr:hypothetical protein AAFF_G00300990 [Aldrovandia affinis]